MLHVKRRILWDDVCVIWSEKKKFVEKKQSSLKNSSSVYILYVLAHRTSITYFGTSNPRQTWRRVAIVYIEDVSNLNRGKNADKTF